MSHLLHVWLQSDNVDIVELFSCLIQSQHVGVDFGLCCIIGAWVRKGERLETNLVTCLHIKFNAPLIKQHHDNKNPKTFQKNTQNDVRIRN